ncbi:hypothetical protein KEU06_24955 [Pseudaminobacter sp. 19-2017]|uniref:Uncharacterized protein n=1 Tax=Pseudaminobacter soli (ex Zhang et al. 2022) TaxID=2831468 RepID=A0A942E2Q6_9HYPH|nr:hypothetical protein [Pseudaminobacter soli]MBS3651862.1 hypothetical protein [Pseudaminobacter soli]
MDIDFATTKLEKVCLTSRALVREFGSAVSEAFERRYAFLEAAPSLADVPAGRLIAVTFWAGTARASGQWP